MSQSNYATSSKYGDRKGTAAGGANNRKSRSLYEESFCGGGAEERAQGAMCEPIYNKGKRGQSGEKIYHNTGWNTNLLGLTIGRNHVRNLINIAKKF